jgi:hypothetical protein
MYVAVDLALPQHISAVSLQRIFHTWFSIRSRWGLHVLVMEILAVQMYVALYS